MDISRVCDDLLWLKTVQLAREHRAVTVALVEHLAEIDARGLWKKKAFSSMFEFCAFGLRLGEASGYRYLRAARALRIFPPLVTLLRDGRLSVEAVVMLHPHLNDADAAALVTRACGLRTKQLEALLSERQAPGPARDVVRFIGSPASVEPAPSDLAQPSLVTGDREPHQDSTPSEPSRPMLENESIPSASAGRSVRLSFTADEEFYRLLGRARALLRHKYPDGRLEGVLGDGLKVLIERKDPLVRWEAQRRRKAKRKNG